MENIIIIGHKNPDTDSICSALSYAWIKTSWGKRSLPAGLGR